MIKKSLLVYLYSALIFYCSLAFSENQVGINKLIDSKISHSFNKIRIVLLTNHPVEYHAFSLKKPNRLVVDLKNTTLEKALNSNVLISQDIGSIRTAEKNHNTLRIVFDLNNEVHINSFQLKPSSHSQARIVFDLFKNPDRTMVTDKFSGKNISETENKSPLLDDKNLNINEDKMPQEDKSGENKSLDYILPDEDAKDFQEELKHIKDPNHTVHNTFSNLLPTTKKDQDSSQSQINKQNQAQSLKEALPDSQSLVINQNDGIVTDAGIPHTKSSHSKVDVDANEEALDSSFSELKYKTMPRKGKIIIVIDPGHGGKDPGATGPHGIHEKNVVLAISRDIQQKINEVPGFSAKLTRNGDYFLTLRQRLAVTRKDKGDFFVAIHADAYMNSDADGASVFALSQSGATSEAARWLADQENYSELGDVKNFGDKSYLVRSVLLDLSQTVTISQSLQIGYELLHTLKDVTSLHHSIVEQARFVVLKSPDIPSLLVETGFITNAHEEARLNSSDYQNKLAGAIAKGIVDYFKEHPPQDVENLENEPTSPLLKKQGLIEARNNYYPKHHSHYHLRSIS